ncbi:MFS transporter [Protaetiibacter intestinalis]|uniref:MFS transporter n=1 Tax=Protaetiibacter intestinalis TaxID=2419774 RepID=A0A387BK12_9MICO|nr:MFS transporter [Protaetiibacter intestinalis]AYF98870.1 MFS transporter [Protaetiibacter intestinalis]
MTTRPLWAGRSLALLGILLVALSLRTPVAALSPILDQVGRDIPLDTVVLGVIGSAPPLAFAASGLLAPLVARRLGLERALMAALGAMVLGHLGRTLAPESLVLTFASMVALLGAGFGNVLLPPVVRRYFPDRVGLVTALYATLLSVSTGIPALLAVPIADSAGWRTSLAVWVLVAAIAAVPWIPYLRRPEPVAASPTETVATGPIELGAVAMEDAQAAATEAAVEHPGAPRGPRLGVRMLRSPTAWSIGVIFGSSSLAAYAAFAWLPKLLTEHAGMDDAAAGALLALYALMGFPAGLLVPVITARFPRSSAPLALLGMACFVVGYLGLLFAPAAAPVVWVASAGLGPLLFPLALVLINLRSASPASTVALSGFVQTVGYLLGATGPFIVGILHDATGGWTVPLVFLLATVVLILPASAILARGRSVDSEL